MKRFLLIPFFIMAASAAQAADLKPNPEPNCTGQLTGQIARGDAARVAAWVEAEYAAQPPAEHPEPVVLCLDSPGGNLPEALEIGRILYDRSVHTRLTENARCLSSCALIFMMGTDQYMGHAEGEVIGPRRSMHTSAELGFHRPELRLPPSDTRRSDADVESSFNLAIEATLLLVELANLPTFEDVMIPADLIQAMFTHRGADFYYIDTTGKAGRWDIRVEGLDWPTAMDRHSLFNACNNLVAWKNSYEENYAIEDVGSVERAVEQLSGGDTRLFAVNGVYWNYDDMHSCLISVPSQGPGLGICGSATARAATLGTSGCQELSDVDPYDEDGIQPFEYHAEALILLPPSTPLSAASAVLAAQSARAAADWQADQSGTASLRRRCFELEMVPEIRGVQNFATLRAAPSFDAEVVAELPPGTRMTPVDPRVLMANGPDNCVSLCRNTESFLSAMAYAGQSFDMDGLNACYDANRVWYELRAPQGATGYVSGKYLRY